jgi:hypothetical protein
MQRPLGIFVLGVIRLRRHLLHRRSSLPLDLLRALARRYKPPAIRSIPPSMKHVLPVM